MKRHQSSIERAILAAIVLAYLVLGTTYALLTPAWQVPDEPAHYNYVRYLVEERRLPVLQVGDYDQAYLEEIKGQKFHPSLSIDPIRYEFHQPPLYYLLLTPVYALTGGSLVALRLFSVLMGAASLGVAYLVGKAVFPNLAWPALGMTAFIALIPQHIAMTAAVENDVLAELLLGLTLLSTLRWLVSQQQALLRTPVQIGLLIGLCLLTKTTAYIAVPLAAIALWLKFRSKWRGNERALIRVGMAIVLPALLLGLPWFVRNAIVYGDLDVTGLKRHEHVVVGQLRTSEWIAQNGIGNLPQTFLRTTFHSFWAQFGWMAVPIDNRIYVALGLLCGIVALGFGFWVLKAWERKQRPSPGAILLVCSGGLTVASYLYYNLSFYQAQGRYLFPALIPLGLAWTLGLRESLSRKNALLIGLVLALATAVGAIRILARTCMDKWRVLIYGIGTAFTGSAWLLPEQVNDLLFALPYLFLAAICAISPFRFIIPYLSPSL